MYNFEKKSLLFDYAITRYLFENIFSKHSKFHGIPIIELIGL